MILTAQGQGTGDPLVTKQHEFDVLPAGLPAHTLRIHIFREMFSEFFNLTLDNGHTEELHYEEIRPWFKDRGADMDACEKALDYAWNFQHADFYITQPKSPLSQVGRHVPRL